MPDNKEVSAAAANRVAADSSFVTANYYQDWQTGVTYSFNSTAPGVLPIDYQRVRLEGINRFSVARRLSGEDLMAKWRQLYRSLPPNTPDNPDATSWYTFEGMSGESITLAAEWIDGSTVVVMDFVNANIAVTETSTEQLGRIRDLLNQEGVKFQITLNN